MTTLTTAQLHDADAIRNFIFGGKATFTLRSQKTGQHISFRVKIAKDGGAFFVSARKNGDHGSGGFSYAGWMKPGERQVRVSKKSHETTTTARRALDWALGHLANGNMPAQLEFHHEGRCACCGRPLTDPVSVDRGFGPHCFSKLTESKVIA